MAEKDEVEAFDPLVGGGVSSYFFIPIESNV